MIAHLQGMIVRLIHRGEESHLLPFEDVVLRPGDAVNAADVLLDALAGGGADALRAAARDDGAARDEPERPAAPPSPSRGEALAPSFEGAGSPLRRRRPSEDDDDHPGLRTDTPPSSTLYSSNST